MLLVKQNNVTKFKQLKSVIFKPGNIIKNRNLLCEKCFLNS